MPAPDLLAYGIHGELNVAGSVVSMVEPPPMAFNGVLATVRRFGLGHAAGIGQGLLLRGQ